MSVVARVRMCRFGCEALWHFLFMSMCERTQTNEKMESVVRHSRACRFGLVSDAHRFGLVSDKGWNQRHAAV